MTDEVLLLHAALLAAGSDGSINAAEKALLEGHFASLPELKTHDFREVFQKAERVLKQYPSRLESAQALSQIASDRVREKAYWLAIDIALCSGDLTPATKDMLIAIEKALAIDFDLATKIREVIMLKYISD